MDDWLMPGIPRTIAEDPSMETVRRIRASVTKDTGQVVESDLLLDCPFCGARPYVQVHELGDTCVEARVVCPSCHVSTVRECQSWRVWNGDDELTRTLAMGRAISAWNRRAERTWHDFSDELPPAGINVLCRGKNGALYVGKPVTFKGNVTRKVWVPRGDQYRTPEKWMEIEE